MSDHYSPASQINPPPPRNSQRATDLEHLRLLSIFHYIVGGLTALMGCFPLIHLGLGIMIVTGSVPQGMDAPPKQDARMIGWIFIAVAIAVIAFAWLMAACLVLAGRWLQQRRHHTFCIVIAALNCLQVPFGTVLGVFTLIVLSRPSVKAMFELPEVEPA